MQRPRIIESSIETKIDRVDIAVVTIDAFTGIPVINDLIVEIKELPNQPIKNLSGISVFINLPEKPEYILSIDATAAGYFNPSPITIMLGDQPQINVPLYRRPSAVIGYEATFIAGTLVEARSSSNNVELKPAQFVSIDATFPEEDGVNRSLFKSLSDEKGAFVVPCRLPDLISEDQRVIRLTFRIEVGNRTEIRRITRKLLNSSFLTFDKLIAIPGPDIDINDEGPSVPNLIEGAK